MKTEEKNIQNIMDLITDDQLKRAEEGFTHLMENRGLDTRVDGNIRKTVCYTNMIAVDDLPKILAKLPVAVPQILQALDSEQKDKLYRALWAEHVQQDVHAWIKDHGQQLTHDSELTECVVNSVTERYVYEGDYDCNQSYWDNIEHLVEEEYEIYEQEGYDR